MAQYLPLMMQQLLSTPLLCSERQGRMIAAAFSGKLDIRSIETETTKLDERGMRDLAETGRLAADQYAEQRRQFNAALGIPDANPYTGLWNGKCFPQVGGIAIIQVFGTLTRTWGLGPYSGTTGYDGIEQMLLSAAQDETVKAIWMYHNSGGGAVDGCFDLQELIWSLNEKNGGKPIWAMAADYSYSAAYALAAAADRVFVPRTGGVGSVGVIMLWADIQKALEQEGVSVRIFRSGKRKALGYGGMEDLPEAEADYIQGQLDEIRDIFVERVAEYRGLSKSAVLQTEGLDYMGRHAKAIGFVDEVVSEHQAWAQLERHIAQ